MKVEKISAIAEIISSVAIVITLIYLTVETRQNTEALNAQSRESILASSQAELFFLTERPELAVLMTKPDRLSVEENIQLDAFLTALFRVREYSWLQYQAGVIDEAQWSTELAVIQSLLSTDLSRLWWNKVGRLYVSAEFSTFLSDLIRNQSTSDDLWKATFDWSDREAQ